MKGRGGEAEDAALHFLEAKGLHLVERNYHCRFGEIDLIMKDADGLVFVEVRMRSSGGAHRDFPACRFDAVLLDGDTRVDWVRNAFGE